MLKPAERSYMPATSKTTSSLAMMKCSKAAKVQRPCWTSSSAVMSPCLSQGSRNPNKSGHQHGPGSGIACQKSLHAGNIHHNTVRAGRCSANLSAARVQQEAQAASRVSKSGLQGFMSRPSTTGHAASHDVEYV